MEETYELTYTWSAPYGWRLSFCKGVAGTETAVKPRDGTLCGGTARRNVEQRYCVATRNKCIAVREVATTLRELTCHTGSHSVTCHPSEVTFPPVPRPKLVVD